MVLVDGKGINQNELIINRSDVAYSLRKEKTMARFYIMQCKESKSDDVFEIPIRDAIDRFGSNLPFFS